MYATWPCKPGNIPDVDIPAAITQIAGRQIAAEKIPSWKEIDDIWYPKHLSLEQCSSEITARYKASLLQGESLADLTGGSESTALSSPPDSDRPLT